MSRADDTIYALSSGPPPSGVAVIRISGRGAAAAIEAMCGNPPQPRMASLRRVRDRDGEVIDQGVVLFFPSPRSFTGEDCVELQLHGGRAVVNAVLTRLAQLGLRLAEAGEFSRRAFENGKLDLVEIEGLADLIAAETEMQRRLAVEQSDGRLSQLYQSWMQRLTRARALIEAALDFPDEDDIPGDVSDDVWDMVSGLADEIRGHLERRKSAEIIRDGFKVVIAGRPNAGKSSLLNALAQRDAAIVTALPGTTRDIISVDMNIGGFLVTLTDTAGLRDTADLIEAEGIRRTRRSLQAADLVLLLKDMQDAGPDEEIDVQAPVERIVTKVDLAADSHVVADGAAAAVAISTLTGQGIESLTKRILEHVKRATGSPGGVTVVRERQAALLREAVEILERSVSDRGAYIEVRSEYLRQASHILGKLTGFVDVEELLGVIFSEFCIGK
jgi:tRNA modification GTPase